MQKSFVKFDAISKHNGSFMGFPKADVQDLNF